MLTGRKIPVIMAVGGFDPSGGAGILADIKTVSSLGCYGVAVLTSVTIQNTRGVLDVHHQSAKTVRDQIAALEDDFQVSAVKTGMLPTEEIVDALATALSAVEPRFLVVDPVLNASAGFDLAGISMKAIIGRLFPVASLVTPNANEAARITGITIVDRESMERAGREIQTMGAQAVLIKGGDMGSEEAVDILIDSKGVLELSGPKIHSSNTHGTGCTMASAIAALLASGRPLREAVRMAKAYVAAAIRTAPGLGHGYGPVNHFHAMADHGAEG
jgi:hydroxymethylpyrimidine kinase/phosphomethylpyrimidine kinase